MAYLRHEGGRASLRYYPVPFFFAVVLALCETTTVHRSRANTDDRLNAKDDLGTSSTSRPALGEKKRSKACVCTAHSDTTPRPHAPRERAGARKPTREEKKRKNRKRGESDNTTPSRDRLHTTRPRAAGRPTPSTDLTPTPPLCARAPSRVPDAAHLLLRASVVSMRRREALLPGAGRGRGHHHRVRHGVLHCEGGGGRRREHFAAQIRV